MADTTVGASQQTGRTRPWRVVLQRGFDSAYRLSDLAAQKISAALDPRARMLRQRRRALRWGVIFGAGCLFWMLATTVLASWSTPVWVLLITCLLAAGAAIPTTLLLLRYRWLRSLPLPAQRPGSSRRLPPPDSAARPAMSALGASERGLFSLLGVLERGNMLPADEIRELTGAANRTAATMAATAAEVASMEQTVAHSNDCRAYLVPTIDAFTAQLNSGVRQYNDMVTAAAQLVASANGSFAAPMSQQRRHDELVGATDRLLGWTYAFEELGELA
jgi:hypothetical protein